jgi:tRNA nucleotidyltransferase (CCA-adding enzyme)
MLGRKCKDIDYSVEADSFDAMRQEIVRRGGEIFVESPQYLTIRAKVPKLGACDFVLCRKDGVYYDGRHPESVEPGSIYDDLARRDFTMNAIAMDEGGVHLDPHDGLSDIEKRLVNCVGWVEDRFREDGLRILRALRFSVVLKFALHGEIHRFLHQASVENYLRGVSVERVREELNKMFKADTYMSLLLLEEYPKVRNAIFLGNPDLWMMPTLRG